MSFENRRKKKPLTDDGRESIEKKIIILEKKKGRAIEFKDELALNKIDTEIRRLEEKIGISKK